MEDFLPIRKAAELVGGLSNLARKLDVSPQLIHRWATGQQEVPIIRCVEIEQITEGKITRPMLRPNDWKQIWPEIAEK